MIAVKAARLTEGLKRTGSLRDAAPTISKEFFEKNAIKEDASR